ncbi:MAG: exodeoxyribonuclease VII small subunit [Methanophagales archaeon]|nr:exodeoxyribonuclease VII small subunit [Methanophagales archaeon]MCW3140826.1 exodeoxyribonuclease VII small subunit [Methanophagales archaeon]
MEEKEGEGITFEEAMKKLESIVETLGEGNLPLDDSLKMFEEGMELCKFCNKKLDEAEYKVEKLMEREGGEISVEKFEMEE